MLDDRRIGAAFTGLGRKMGGASPADAAQGVIDVANANMEAALRVISVERGYDPRDFTLVTFGGAGGLHAVELAAGLAIPRVLIPENPGLLSALGVLLSDSVQDFSRTVMRTGVEAAVDALEKPYGELEREGIDSMIKEGFPRNRIRVERWIDMRYRGQSYEISFPFSRRCAREFHRRHELRYGYADPTRESEVVTIRVRIRGLSKKPRMPKDRSFGSDPKRALLNKKKVRFQGKVLDTRVYERSLLRAGNRIHGPALIFEYSATTAVPPGCLGRVDGYRNLILTPE